MANEKTPRKRIRLPKVNKQNIDQLEQEALHRVNRTLSSLEIAIADWDAAETKPEDLKPKFMKYKWLHNALTEWERRMLRSLGKKEDFIGINHN